MFKHSDCPNASTLGHRAGLAAVCAVLLVMAGAPPVRAAAIDFKTARKLCEQKYGVPILRVQTNSDGKIICWIEDVHSNYDAVGNYNRPAPVPSKSKQRHKASN